MLENSFGMSFYLKHAKNQKENLRYVYLRITVDGKSAELSTKQLWSPLSWNIDAGRALGNKEGSRTLNAYLDTLSSKVFQATKMLIEDDKELSSEALKNILLGKSSETRTILLVFQYHNEQMEALVGKEFAPLTLSRCRAALEHTRSFIQWKYKMDDRQIRDLDFEFISEFSFWLSSARGCNHNLAIEYMSNLKKIVLICVDNNFIQILIDFRKLIHFYGPFNIMPIIINQQAANKIPYTKELNINALGKILYDIIGINALGKILYDIIGLMGIVFPSKI